MRLSVMRKNSITAQKAYEILCKKYPTERAKSCLEYDDFYLFSMVPLYVSDKDSYSSGTEFDAVDKKTGKVFDYDITTDIDAYLKATPISVSTYMDIPLSEIDKQRR